VVSGGIQVGSHGTISAGSSAIVVTNTTTFAGGITNSGTISAGHSHDGIFVSNTSIFSGGIRNAASGRIAAGASGIEVKLVTTFAGGISNAGTISASDFSRVGIYLSKDAVFGSSSAGGRITNTGTISSGAGAGIDLFKQRDHFCGPRRHLRERRNFSGRHHEQRHDLDGFHRHFSQDRDDFSWRNNQQRHDYIQNKRPRRRQRLALLRRYSQQQQRQDCGRLHRHRGQAGHDLRRSISNAGTIFAGADGIFVENASLFSGDIVNSGAGRIAAGSTGIEVKLVTTFAGASVTRARFSRALTAFSSKTLRSSPATSSIAAPAGLRPAPPASRSSWSLPSRATSAT
jgi:hypothetical protein